MGVGKGWEEVQREKEEWLGRLEERWEVMYECTLCAVEGTMKRMEKEKWVGRERKRWKNGMYCI